MRRQGSQHWSQPLQAVIICASLLWLSIRQLCDRGHWYRLSKSAKTDSIGLRGNEKINEISPAPRG